MRQEIKVLNYEPLEKSVAKLFKGEILYRVNPDWRGCETEASVTLYWEQERHMWLARVDGKFLEGYERGGQVFLDFSHGPFTLNQSARKKLLETYYGINPSWVNLLDISKMDSSHLEKLANMTKDRMSLDNMRNLGIEELTRVLVSLQETQRETKIASFRSEGDWGDTRGWGYWIDHIEYEFQRGLPNVPEGLLSYLKRGGSVREHFAEAAVYLRAHSKEIATEVLCSRGPLPTRDWPEKYNFSHTHYQPSDVAIIPKNALEEIAKQLFEDTEQSLKEYAERILQS